MKIQTIVIKVLRKLYYLFSYRYSYLVTVIKFWLWGIGIPNGMKCRGIPLIHVGFKAKMYVGENFGFNSGKYHNMIGRQQQCFFMIYGTGQLKIGNNVSISSTAIVCYNNIEIADNVIIGGGCAIYDSDFHSLYSYERNAVPEITINIKTRPIKICSGAFIGSNSTILKGVTIGENSIIGAGAVVSKSIPDNEIWAGNPARFIRSLL